MGSDEKIMKKCGGICGKMLELNSENFHKNVNRKSGFRGQCKKCVGKGVPSNIIEENNIKYQICTGECGLKLEINTDNFEWRNDQNKFRQKCKKCSRIQKKEYENRPENKLKDEINRNKPENKEKKYEYDKEYRNRPNKREENKNRGKKFYEENKEELKLKSKEDYEKNKNTPEFKERRKAYTSDPKNKARSNQRHKERLQNDPTFKLRCRVSSIIGAGLKNNKTSKNGASCLKYLNYTMQELREYIEKQFLEPGNEWMTWDNWTIYDPLTWDDNDKSTWVWHLDHIIPQSLLPYDSMEHPNFQKSWALENLRPYSGKDNVIDGATRIRHKKK